MQELPYASELHDLAEEMLKFSLSPTATVERLGTACMHIIASSVHHAANMVASDSNNFVNYY